MILLDLNEPLDRNFHSVLDSAKRIIFATKKSTLTIITNLTYIEGPHFRQSISINNPFSVVANNVGSYVYINSMAIKVSYLSVKT